MNDPYGEFEWSAEYDAPIPILFGLLPCMCEQGWLPLLDGSAISCPTCSEDND